MQRLFYPFFYISFLKGISCSSYEKIFKYILKPQYGRILTRELEFHYQGLIYFQIDNISFLESL